MPVAMTATADVWTDRFHRLRGLRNRPPEADVEADPDDCQGDDHAQQPGVDLQGPEQPAIRPPRLVVEGLGAATAGSVMVQTPG